MLVALAIGHLGSGRRGARNGAYIEEALAMRYVLAAAETLMHGGVEVAILGHGGPTERQAWAAKNADVFAECHINAGGGDYGAVFFDERSARGKAMAASVASELWDSFGAEASGPLARVKAIGAKPWTTDGQPHWTTRAYNVIGQVYDGRPAGLVIEPAFIDTAAHRGLFTPEALERIGWAVARGILRALFPTTAQPGRNGPP